MEDPGVYNGVSILDVLAIWPCARAIFEYVPVWDLVRSERVSRDWQHAVYNHLQSSRYYKLLSGLYDSAPSYDYLPNIIHLSINKENSWLILSKTVKKLGPYIVSLDTNCGDAEHLRIIRLNCPYLKKIVFHDIQINNRLHINKFRDIFYNSGLENFSELKDIIVICSKNIDLLLNQPSQTASGFENIHVRECPTTGSFLKNLTLNELKSLTFNCADKLNISHIESNLPNLIELNLNHNGNSVLQNVHKVLSKTPRLEKLSLGGYSSLPSKKKLLESLGQLSNLKELILSDNPNVDDELINVVVQNCKKLEYLDIAGYGARCLQSIAAACRRPPPAETILCLGWISNFTTAELAKYIKQLTYLRELQALACIEVTPQWLEATALASQNGNDIQVQLRQARTTVLTGQPAHELKIRLEYLGILDS